MLDVDMVRKGKQEANPDDRSKDNYPNAVYNIQNSDNGKVSITYAAALEKKSRS
jgi:hypothetical protein